MRTSVHSFYLRALVPTDLAPILGLPHVSCVTLVKSLTFSESLFFIHKENIIYLMGCCEGLGGKAPMKVYPFIAGIWEASEDLSVTVSAVRHL